MTWVRVGTEQVTVRIKKTPEKPWWWPPFLPWPPPEPILDIIETIEKILGGG